MPRLGEDEFQIVAKLSACQIAALSQAGGNYKWYQRGYGFIEKLLEEARKDYLMFQKLLGI